MTMATKSLELLGGEAAGLAGVDSDIVQRLHSVNISGKFVGYAAAEGGGGVIVSFKTKKPSSTGLIPAQSLAVGVTLLLSSTEDFTDAEASQTCRLPY